MPHGHLDARVIIVYGLLAMIGAARAETAGEAASTCAIAAGDMVAALGRGDSKAATSRFDAPLRRALPEPTLSGVWDATISAHGAYVGHGTPTLSAGTAEFPFVATVPMRFASRTVNGVVACNAKGEVSGFHLVVPEATNAP